MINNIHIQNFTVFNDTKINFSKGINVLIGQNGTGKTHLLKLLYALCGTENHKDDLDRLRSIFLQNYLIVKFNFGAYRIIEDIPEVMKNNNKNNIHLLFMHDNQLAEYEKRYGKKIPKIEPHFDMTEKQELLFIPAKEMLTHATSLLALDRERQIPFDKTLLDIIAKAELGESKQNSPFEKILLEKIGTVIDGTVVYENDTFFLHKTSGEKIPFTMEADGLKKFGLLWKLIRNGLINKDTILLWDEPEANINPELMPVLVDILLELQRNGVQIFVATHSYNMAKYFEIKKQETDSILFHSLYKTTHGSQCETQNTFTVLEKNPITQSYITLYDDEIQKGL